MNSYTSIFYLIGSFIVAIPLVYLAFKFRDAASDFEAKLTGVWTNEADTIRILIHNIDTTFQGDIIWVDTNAKNESLLGRAVFRDLQPRMHAQGSFGIYVDSESGMELPFRLWLQGNGTLRFALISKSNGKNHVVREEKWRQV